MIVGIRACDRVGAAERDLVVVDDVSVGGVEGQGADDSVGLRVDGLAGEDIGEHDAVPVDGNRRPAIPITNVIPRNAVNGELLQLLIGNVDLRQSSVSILGKGRKQRYCPLWPVNNTGT